MKFRTVMRRSTVIIVILLAAVLIGYLCETVGKRLDLKRHPRSYAEYVEKYAAEYGVPEYTLYGVMAAESDFQSNFVSEDGRIGLMQLDKDSYYRVAEILHETAEAGILYDPDTNIRFGAYLLSTLYAAYGGRWRPAYIAFEAGREQAEIWAADAQYLDEYGNLTKTPDEGLNAKIDEIEKTVETYRSLYYGGANS